MSISRQIPILYFKKIFLKIQRLPTDKLLMLDSSK